MEQKETYDFTEDEVHIITEALAMYAGYQKEMVIPYLMGDESDFEQVVSHANASKRLCREFFEIDRGLRWEEVSDEFYQEHGRPMDVNDVSKYDWFENN